MCWRSPVWPSYTLAFAYAHFETFERETAEGIAALTRVISRHAHAVPTATRQNDTARIARMA